MDVERAQRKIKNTSKAGLAQAKLQVFEAFLNKIK